MAYDNNATYSDGNLQTVVNATLGDENKSTNKFYLVTASVFLLAIVCLVGLVTNISLLATILWKRRMLCTLHYALPFNLLLANLVFCILWAPAEIIQVLLTYNYGSCSATLLFYTGCLFIHCIVLLLVTIVFIALYQICYQVSDNKHCMDCISIAGLITSWLGGALVALAHGLLRDDAEPMMFRFTELVVTILAIIGLLLLTLIVIIILRKNQLEDLRNENVKLGQRDSNPCSVSESRSVTKSEPEEKETKTSQLCLNLGLSGKSKTAAAECTVATRGISFAKGSNQKVNQDNVSEISEDDDSFDTKMRLQFRALASRRHTIGNVGENPFHQPSLFGNRGGPAKANNYQYVRKWSVDVIALQDQLENPKRHGGSLPFQELAKLPEKEIEPLIPENIILNRKTKTEAIIEENANQNKDTLSNHEDENPESPDEDPKMLNSKPKEKKPNTKSTTFSDVTTEKDTNDIVVESVTAPLPTIVVNGNNSENLTNSCEQQTDQEINKQNCKTLSRYIKVIKYILCLALVYSFWLLPFIIYVLFIQKTDHYLKILLMALASIQVIIHPFLLYHIERKIKQTFCKLRLRVTHWRFVCYCNTCTVHRQRSDSIKNNREEGSTDV